MTRIRKERGIFQAAQEARRAREPETLRAVAVLDELCRAAPMSETLRKRLESYLAANPSVRVVVASSGPQPSILVHEAAALLEDDYRNKVPRPGYLTDSAPHANRCPACGRR